MFTEAEQTADATIPVGNLIVAIHVIDRLAVTGKILGSELATIGLARHAMVNAVEKATGKNIDAERRKAAQEADSEAKS